MQDRQALPSRKVDSFVCFLTLANQNEAIGFHNLHVRGCPQRACGQAQTVAEARAAIHEHQIQVLRKRRVLKAVIHDENVNRLCLGKTRARWPVGRNDRGRMSRQKQRFIADVFRIMHLRIDQKRPLGAPAISSQ